MSERDVGIGPFLLGVAVGAALGFLFAPEAGEEFRGEIGRRLKGLRELASEKADELEELVGDVVGEVVGDMAGSAPARPAPRRRALPRRPRRKRAATPRETSDE